MPARTAVPHLLTWLKSPRSGVDVTAVSNALGALCACVGDVGGGEGVCISGRFRVRMFMDRVPRAVEGQVCAAVSFFKYLQMYVCTISCVYIVLVVAKIRVWIQSCLTCLLLCANNKGLGREARIWVNLNLHANRCL